MLCASASRSCSRLYNEAIRSTLSPLINPAIGAPAVQSDANQCTESVERAYSGLPRSDMPPCPMGRFMGDQCGVLIRFAADQLDHGDVNANHTLCVDHTCERGGFDSIDNIELGLDVGRTTDPDMGEHQLLNRSGRYRQKDLLVWAMEIDHGTLSEHHVLDAPERFVLLR